MGRTHLPISVSTIKALHRFSLGNNRGNCNTPLNFALQTTDCGLAGIRGLTSWASKPDGRSTFNAGGTTSSEQVFLCTSLALLTTKQRRKSKKPLSANCQNRYSKSGSYIHRPRPNPGAWM